MKKSTHNKRINPLMTKHDQSEPLIGEVRTKKCKDVANDTIETKLAQKQGEPKTVERCLSPLSARTCQGPKDNTAQTDYPFSKNVCGEHIANSNKISDFNNSLQCANCFEAEPDCSACICQNAEEQNKPEVKTYVLFNAETTKNNIKHVDDAEQVAHIRKTMSSVEICYTDGACMKQVAYSSTDVGALSNSSIGHLNSFHTLFRGGY